MAKEKNIRVSCNFLKIFWVTQLGKCSMKKVYIDLLWEHVA